MSQPNTTAPSMSSLLGTGENRVPVYDSARRPHPFFDELIELYRYRDLVALWTIRNITLRYKRSVLGIGWTLLEPLMMMTIMTFVFSTLFRAATGRYPIYVLTGILVMNFFSRSTNQVIDEAVSGNNLASRIHVPRSAFALATVISFLANWTLALIPLFAIMLFLRQPFSWTLLAIPAVMLMAGLFAIGIGLMVATLGAFFHDIKLTYSVLLTAWFYATPVIYPVEILPERFRGLLVFNPMFHLLRLFRLLVIDGRFPATSDWLISGVICLGTATAGWWIFTLWRKAIEYRI